MPVALKRAINSSEPSAYERFHCIFQAAVTQELEVLVGDMRSAAAHIADKPFNLSELSKGDVHPKMQDALGEKKTLRSFFSVRAAYWPGRLSRPYASRISACLSLRKARGACSCQSRGLRREAGKPRPSRFGERAWWTHWPRRRWWT